MTAANVPHTRSGALTLVSGVTRANTADTPNTPATHSRRITETAALARPPRGNQSPPAPGQRTFPGSPTGGGAPVRSSTRAVGGVMGPDAQASVVAKSSSPGLIYESS